MKRFGWILVLWMATVPAWAAGKMTVQQLRDLLISLQKANTADADVAAQLKDVELTEEMTRSVMNSLGPYVPGQLTTEQLFVLEARSAVLAPPAADLPSTPAPDAATQKAILDKAIDYTNKTYAQLPDLTATRTTRRFQDNVEPPKGSVAAHSSATLAPPSPPIRYMTGEETKVTLLHGAEQNPLANDKTKWGDNGKIALLGQEPVLSTVIREALAAGKINWVRWETIDGKQAAVYTFAVDKKTSHYAVNYCCFPESTQGGDMVLRGTGSAGGDNKGNYAVNQDWKNYKATIPYHGEIFVDPDSGTVVRLITQADFKSGELVRQEDQCIQFGSTTVGDKPVVVPVTTFIDTLSVPYGDSLRGRSIFRHTLFISEYKNYEASAAH
jgi:hypothetical protein